MSDAVLTEVRGRVLLITLNRPEAMNAINTDLAQGLLRAVGQLDSDDGLTAGVLTGAGARASAPGWTSRRSPPAARRSGWASSSSRAPTSRSSPPSRGSPSPAGCEMALTCDLLVAASNVKLGIPEAGVGLFAAGGAVLRLPGRVPYAVAMEMALDGRSDHRRAGPVGYGLVARLTEQGKAVDVRHGAGRAHRPQRPAVGAPPARRSSRAPRA